jgi:hypothetical protein
MKCLIFFLVLTSVSTQGLCQDTIKVWSEFEKQHLKNQEDSTTWSKELLQRDIDDSVNNRTHKPFRRGAFPVPKYELAGYYRYKGEGSSGGSFPNYYGKRLTYHVYSKGATEATKELLKEKPNEAFFIIVSLIGYADTAKGLDGGLFILSRNNPDVICQGYFNTQNKDEIDYMAFITGDRQEFAVVNLKLFNLKNGRIILVAPQKDHSLRFLQIHTPLMAANDVQGYLNKLVEQDRIKAFLQSKGSL